MVLLVTGLVVPAAAQTPAPAPAAPDQHAQAGGEHDHAAPVPGAAPLFRAREASGTGWLPDATPMYGWHGQAGPWSLMAHGVLFAQVLHEEAEVHRGATQGGSSNWLMVLARRPAAGGRLGLRGMFSAEPWTIPGCGYPDLLATGELCERDAIHDRQHPHDLFMELAAEYRRPLAGGWHWQLYAGLAGEPALGPVAFPHRPSAMPNPIAPIGHHWLDASHITFGVVTAGLLRDRWTIEASAFNGREPDEDRWDLDLAALDSVAARVAFAPVPSLAVQISAGRLREAEDGPGDAGRTDAARVTASAAYHRPAADGVWATTVAWGRKTEEDVATHALLLESSVTLRDRDVWFGRLEVGGKPGHDLHVHEREDEVFVVGKLQAGYTRLLGRWRGVRPGVGGYGSVSAVPAVLQPRYGRRFNPGVGVFLALRPAVHRM